MKQPYPPVEPTRFSGNLRHYHRSGSQTQRSWDDWVDGVSAKPRGSNKWKKVVGIGICLLALCGIVAGLIVELG